MGNASTQERQGADMHPSRLADRLLKKSRPTARAEAERDTRAVEQEDQEYQRRERVRNSCLGILQKAASDEQSAMTPGDVAEYMQGMSEEALADAKSNKEKMEWLLNLTSLAEKFAQETQTFGRMVMSQIESPLSKELIDKNSAARWKESLKSRDPRENWPAFRQKLLSFIKADIKKFRTGWEELELGLKVVDLRRTLLGLSASALPELRALEKSAFKAKKFPDKKQAIVNAKSALDAYEQNYSALREEAYGFLSSLAGRSLASGKVQPWMDKIFKGRTLAPARAYLKNVKAFAGDWEKVRQGYDGLQETIDNEGTPRGCTLLDADAFLELPYSKRVNYVRMVSNRLQHYMKDKEYDSQATNLKMAIWHDFDAKDWENASFLIDELKKIAPKDEKLPSMIAYLKDNWNKKKAQEDTREPKEVVEDTLGIINRSKPDANLILKNCIERDLEEGKVPPPRTKAFGTAIFNTSWAEDEGHLDQEKVIQNVNSKKVKSNTQKYMKYGHTQEVEHIRVDGSTADESAIRDDNTTAQVIYGNSDTQSQLTVFHEVDEHKDDASWAYWSDYVGQNTPISWNSNFVEVEAPRLKKNMRYMQSKKMLFDEKGTVRFKDEDKNKKQSEPSISKTLNKNEEKQSAQA